MSGIQSIVELIRSKTAERVEKILRDAETVRTQKIREAEERGTQIGQTIIESATSDVRSQLIRHEAGARLRAKHAVLKAKEEILQDVLHTAQSRAKEMTDKKEYREILFNLVADAVSVFNDTPELELVFPDGQETRLTPEMISEAIKKRTGREIKFRFSDETVIAEGGLIVRTPDRRRWVDNTFDARFERMISEIREAASSILFGEK